MFRFRLKELRGSMSQQELANQLHVSRGAVGMWESNERMPNYKMLIKIANYFNVSIDYLLGNDVMVERLNNALVVSDERKPVIELLLKMPDSAFADISSQIKLFAKYVGIN